MPKILKKYVLIGLANNEHANHTGDKIAFFGI